MREISPKFLKEVVEMSANLIKTQKKTIKNLSKLREIISAIENDWALLKENSPIFIPLVEDVNCSLSRASIYLSKIEDNCHNRDGETLNKEITYKFLKQLSALEVEHDELLAQYEKEKDNTNKEQIMYLIMENQAEKRRLKEILKL